VNQSFHHNLCLRDRIYRQIEEVCFLPPEQEVTSCVSGWKITTLTTLLIRMMHATVCRDEERGSWMQGSSGSYHDPQNHNATLQAARVLSSRIDRCEHDKDSSFAQPLLIPYRRARSEALAMSSAGEGLHLPLVVKRYSIVTYRADNRKPFFSHEILLYRLSSIRHAAIDNHPYGSEFDVFTLAVMQVFNSHDRRRSTTAGRRAHTFTWCPV
jgi:hypothetical protein